ncbi:MAG: WD40 repeat domain-containing protein, partial [Planctomycetaceae bacterium]
KVLTKNTVPDDGQVSRIHGPQLGLRSSRIAFERSWRGDKGEWLHSHEIRSLDNGEVLWHHELPGWSVSSLRFSPDEQVLAVFLRPAEESTETYRLVLYSAADGRELKSFDLEDSRVLAMGTPTDVMAFSPDGRRLVTGMEAGDALVWDISDVNPAQK